jgi:CubicO group peptidase (beta-lactamase class C family)
VIDVHGSFDEAFAPLAEAFVAMFERNPTSVGLPELGAALSLVVDGEAVVDIWAGALADDARTPWQADTLVPVLSATKGMVAIAFHRLAERGVIDVEAPVAHYWPEYAANGKHGVLVRHLLTHTAGQPSLKTDLEPGGVWDWDAVTQAFATAPVQWTPGEAVGYHTLSFGHLVGEVIRRASGRPVTEHLADLAKEFDVDVHLGVNDATLPRCSDLTEPPDDSPFIELARQARGVNYDRFSNYDDRRIICPAGLASRAWKRGGYPGAGAFSNARSLATIYGALATGRILPGGYVKDVSHERVRGLDRTLGSEQAFALGWQVAMSNKANRPTTGFGHSGAWGSLGWCELERRIGFGYTMNRTFSFSGDERGAYLWRAATACL